MSVPDGFVVRLHDDVHLGRTMVAGSRVMRLSDAALALIVDRTVTVTSGISGMLVDRMLDLDLADPVVGDAQVLASTVVVPVRDNPRGVDRLLGLLAANTDCIVVDDASADAPALADVVARHGARLVRLDHNVGPAAARDVGLRLVDTPLVTFVDSDIAVEPAALQALAQHFVDPRLAAVAPRVRGRNGQRWWQKYELDSGSLDLGPNAATVRSLSPVSYVPSACLMVRVSAMGVGFDPALRSGEDVDLVWRLQSQGHRVRYAAEISALHDSRSTVWSWLGRKIFYGSSAAPLAKRHGDQVAPAVMTAPVAVMVVGLLVQRRWSLAVAAVASGFFVRDAMTGLNEVPARQRASVISHTAAAMAQQTSGLMLRHWWPVSLVLALFSRRYRRALVAVGVVDGVCSYAGSGRHLDPVRFTVARRLDDVAYGAGVWHGAWRERSIRCVVPRWVSTRRRS